MTYKLSKHDTARLRPRLANDLTLDVRRRCSLCFLALSLGLYFEC